MRLRQIKLAGFKSFVDPTTINLPGNRTGIIGPNGCGKSNVIDAVRWVMGETSARQLRGDSMDDVIFNGSSSRPAVSRASVDLIFDNSDHSLGGQYANYNEISVRREVTREGQSNYFLNNTRCRRRDIADIFLGTGLGPRSYAIIEQGMISRIIEAKPEELRVYLEEAAGITKYKERRRETENRIRHTRENLERLDDLRDEVDKQLNHLKRQANAAERYKELKASERRLKAELLALRWRALDAKVREDQAALEEQQTKVEAVVAEQRAVELQIEKLRDAGIESNDHLSEVQGEFYRVGADISRVEQSIAHHRDTRQRQLDDLKQAHAAWQELQQHVEDDKARLQDVTQTIESKKPILESLQKNQQASAARLAEADKAMQQAQQDWETFNREEAEAAKTVQVEQTRLEQLTEHLQRLQVRQQRLQEEQAHLVTDELQAKLDTLLDDEAQHARNVDDTQKQQEAARQAVLTARANIEQFNDALDASRGEAQDLRGTLASLEALQQAALGKDKAGIVSWLERRGLHNNQRLAEALDVEAGWERAVETVLGDALEAVCVDDLDPVSTSLAELTEDGLMLVDQRGAGAGVVAQSLAAKVRSKINVTSLFAGIHACDSLQQALQMRSNLRDGESVITPEGLWLGANWLRVARQAAGQESVLAREQQIKELRARLDELQQRISATEDSLQAARQTLHEQEARLQSLQQTLQQYHDQLAEVRAQRNGVAVQLEQIHKRRNELGEELAGVEEQMQNDRAAQIHSRETLQGAERLVSQNSEKRQQLLLRRESASQALQASREAAQTDKDALHEIALNLESMRTMQNSTDQSIGRLQQQLNHLQRRRDELEEAVNAGDDPVKQLETELAGLLEARVEVEKRLSAARKQVEIIDSDVRKFESERSGFENRVQELRSALEQGRLAAQEARVRCQTIHEQLQESGFQREQLFNELAADATIEVWHDEVEKLEQRIQRMGPINLAAIDEHKEQAERKEYLDSQHADLTEALSTLEAAISKIDKETRSRFKEIFDQVNTTIKDMFPRLFGGGQAHLEMIGDDLLSTGVSIMARPPGKRISNIHLLSGGEKALTAVAMVFAIFQLNPAPFCLLDEVDAPLDEANVARFNDLVREMSNKVQFIVITHNKTTMEMVDQLTGVTMREAGVSRIVAVDVDEAVKMATA